MSTDEYVPSDEDAADNYVFGRGSEDPGLSLPELRAEYGPEFDRFLASVRRDAAREALDGLTKHATALAEDGNAESFRSHWWTVAGLAEGYRDTHYPEGAEHG
ncbi:hypothetical protein Y09_1355 [Brachybacterium sp. SW0106-09]|uniref:hypothetical protein n=1 Tax=Brachybacterium sp. SW0106-09 TaxID=1704590 RepID=UPI0006B41730|nr:hypothetical protein [Brachybacterium sp. SW0106-09]GAP78526.1 hypothetical protein Y09_1355 [Brachybacterium sp. SW0106-09]